MSFLILDLAGTVNGDQLNHRLSSLALTDETAIRWNTLTWDSWTGRDLRRHWCSLKGGIDGSEGLLFPGKIIRFCLHSVLNPSGRNLEHGP